MSIAFRIAWLELKMFCRTRSAVLWTVAMPLFMLLLLTRVFGGRTYTEFIVTGVIAMNVASIALFAIGTVLVSYRERGVLKRLLVSPITPVSFIAAHLINRNALIILQAMLFAVIAYLGFGIRPNGSVPAMLSVLVIGSMTMSAIGIAIASMASDIRSVTNIANMCFLPSLFLGGAYFPVEALPPSVSTVGAILPVGLFLQSFRSVYSGGAPLLSQTQNLAILLVWGALAVVFSVRYFRWE